jgi:hypothetical protein
MERGAHRASPKARPRRSVDGVGQRGRSGRLAEIIATVRLPGATEEVGGGEDDRLDRPEQKDEQGLREALCERGSVRICCHESPHGEAVVPLMRPFHTVSEVAFYEVRNAKQHSSNDRHTPHGRSAEFCNRSYYPLWGNEHKRG